MAQMENQDLSLIKDKTERTGIQVSVIIPVYNTEPYLAECLDSIINQSLKEIEIICVDDGSTDGSEKILRKYANQDSRISIYTQKNFGASAARNKGVKYALGEYLYFMDSDDILEPDCLQKIYDIAKEKELEVLYFDASSFSDCEDCKEIAEKYHNYYNRKNQYPAVTTGPQLMTEMLKNEEYRVAPPLCLISRKFFLEYCLWFIEGIVQEDNYFTYCCMLNAKRAGYIKKICYKRRVRAGSVMTSKPAFKNSYGYFIVHLKMREILEKCQLSPEEEKAASEIMYRNFQNAKNIFAKLDENEEELANDLPENERVLFKAYIVNNIEKERKHEKIHGDHVSKLQEMKQNHDDLNEKLKRTYQEKSELNAKLQTTYQEKSELNAKLQTTYQEKSELNAKLQATYQEKSELNEKLQATYQEKYERGQEIKRLKEEVKKKEEQIEELSKNPGVRLAQLFKR